jgi:hypothetical protein
MRTGKRLAAEFANAGGALLGEYFSERELKAIEESGSALFLFVETRGRVFPGHPRQRAFEDRRPGKGRGIHTEH